MSLSTGMETGRYPHRADSNRPERGERYGRRTWAKRPDTGRMPSASVSASGMFNVTNRGRR